LAFATFLVWRLRTGACGVGACGFWRYRMPPKKETILVGPGKRGLEFEQVKGDEASLSEAKGR